MAHKDEFLWDHNPFAYGILCGCEIATLEKLAAVFPEGARFLSKLIDVRRPLEAEEEAATWIRDHMNSDDPNYRVGDLNDALKLEHRDAGLRRQLLSHVNTLDDFLRRNRPSPILKDWVLDDVRQRLHSVQEQLCPESMRYRLRRSLGPPEGSNFCFWDEGDTIASRIDVSSLTTLFLHSRDGEILTVDTSVAFQSHLIRRILDGGIVDHINPLNVDGETLRKVVYFCERLAAAAKAKFNEASSTVDEIEAEFNKMDEDTLIEITWAADFLQVPGLLNLAFKRFAASIKQKKPHEIRQKIEIGKFLLRAEKNLHVMENPDGNTLLNTDRMGTQRYSRHDARGFRNEGRLPGEHKRVGRARRGGSTNIVCWNCNQPGHKRRNCTANMICWNCNQPGHKRRNCTANMICYRCGGRGHLASACRAHGPV